MNATGKRFFGTIGRLVFPASVLLFLLYSAALFGFQAQQAGSAGRAIGSVKAINGMVITLSPDSGSDVNITLQPATRIVRIAPGEKDLKNATPIPLQDIQVGDRILVGGKFSDDKASLAASSVVVMKGSDLAVRHEQDLRDWQKRGVDGLAKGVDAAAGTVTITVRGKDVIVQASKSTAIRRYAPDSVKFDDARPSTLSEIHPGDQVRARGDRSADGTTLTAEEIVSGAFRNIAGTVNSVDASSSTLTVHDLLSGRNLVIKITPDSQLRHLPADMAQRIAMRLKGAAMGAAASSASGANGQTLHQAGGGSGPSTSGSSGRSGGPPDFQQMLSRLPAASLADLHKGDAVVMVSTEGTEGAATAITLLSGVEPILQAAPSASSSSILSPWSLSAPAGDNGGP
ncbi:MAG: DUF5666 domain-containing protein [Candidatus Sulfotelmatobacter sp.]